MTALRKAAGVRMSRGRTSSATSPTMRRPASATACHSFGLPASTGAAPGSAMPSASAAMCIEFAVPIPAQTPGPVTAHRLISASSLTVIFPVATCPA